MKNMILFCFVVICTTAFSQQHATSYTHCQLKVDDILRMQSFDIDAPVSEQARYIFFEMYEELNLLYQSNSKDPKRSEYVNDFNETLKKAADLNLNVSMFKKDIDYVSKKAK